MNDSKVNVGVGKVPLHLQSSQNRLHIKGGKIVNADRMFDADIYVEDGVIKQVGTNLMTPGGVKVIDAKGKMIIPGGIDTHTHMEFPFMGTVSCDDFYSGTRAAVAGGTTMIIDFVMNTRGNSLLENYHSYRQKADSKVCCDYGLHVIIPEFNDRVASEIEILAKDHGINSFKAFMAYKDALMIEDDELYELMKKCKSIGALVLVHAENGKLIEKKTEEVVSKGITGPEGHLYSREEDVEAEATNRAIMLADQANCPVYIVHVMSKSSADVISAAKREGKLVFGEPIAAGLGVTGNNYFHTCWRHSAGYVMSPPLRRDMDTAEYLMKMLASGDLECTGTDHCVFNSSQKALGKDDFRKIPNGINGVEDRMSVIWEKGVVTGIIDPCKFVAVTSTNAARVFNVYPRKGRIDIGCDADLVIWNPNATRTISAQTHHQKVDFNIFEGMTCHGVAETVISGGRILLEDGQLKVAQGTGRFVPTPPHSEYVYGRVDVRDEVRSKDLKKIEREPYTGEVIDISKEMSEIQLNPDSGNKQNGNTNNQNSGAGGAKEDNAARRPPTSSGGRHMQDSSFSLSGTQIDDRNPGRSSIRTHQPPGGASTSLW